MESEKERKKGQKKKEGREDLAMDWRGGEEGRGPHWKSQGVKVLVES